MAGQTILLIEDDPDLREVTALLLEREGYAVLSAEDGVAALEMLDLVDEVPGLVLLDLNMPRMNGWEFLSAQRRDPRIAAVPVLVLSAHDRVEPDLEVSGYIAKPYDQGHLVRAIESTLSPRPYPMTLS